MDLIKGGLAVASGLYLVHVVTDAETKEIFSNKKVAHGAIGAIVGVLSGNKLEYLVKNGFNVPEDRKKVLRNTLLGMAGGGVCVYLLSEGRADNMKQYLGFKKKDNPVPEIAYKPDGNAIK